MADLNLPHIQPLAKNSEKSSKFKWQYVLVVAIFYLILIYYLFPTPSPEEDLGTRSVVQDMEANSHILITGGAGYIGSHATFQALKKGFDVTILDNYSRGNKGVVKVLKQEAKALGRELTVVEVDLGHFLKVENVLSSSRFDAVLHFAAVAYVGESYKNPVLYYNNITSNTVNVLKAINRLPDTRDKPVMIYSSTCAVYGHSTMPSE